MPLLPFRPIFEPTGRRNARRARCFQCRREVPGGAGHQWAHTFGPAFPKIYCPTCHIDRLELLQVEPELEILLKAIHAWCDRWVNLYCGPEAFHYIERLVQKAGVLGADVAESILEQLPHLQDTSYSAVTRMADATARDVCAQKGGEHGYL